MKLHNRMAIGFGGLLLAAAAALTSAPAVATVTGISAVLQSFGVVGKVAPVAAIASVATAGAAARDVLLPAESHTAVPATSGRDMDFGFVDKHQKLYRRARDKNTPRPAVRRARSSESLGDV